MLISALTENFVYPNILPLTGAIQRYQRRQTLAGLFSHLLAVLISRTCWTCGIFHIQYTLLDFSFMNLCSCFLSAHFECFLGSCSVQWQRVLQLNYLFYRASCTCFFKPAVCCFCLLPLVALWESSIIFLCATEDFVNLGHISAWRLMIYWITPCTKALLLCSFLLPFSESLPLLLYCFWAAELSSVWYQRCDCTLNYHRDIMVVCILFCSVTVIPNILFALFPIQLSGDCCLCRSISWGAQAPFLMQ